MCNGLADLYPATKASMTENLIAGAPYRRLCDLGDG